MAEMVVRARRPADFEALVDLGIDVVLYYPPGETNSQLLAAADSSRALNVKQLWNWLDPEFERSNPLPTESFLRSIDISLVGQTPVLYFEDHNYGQVHLYKVPDEPWRMVTAVTPTFEFERLHVRSMDLEMLRNFVEDFYGIRVPAMDISR